MIPAAFTGTERYEVVRVLGSGGMGEVYEVVDREQDAHVALKLLHRSDPRFVHRFKREFRALQGLAHPNLCALGQLHEVGGWWFFTMELVDGVDFREHVRGSEDRLRAALRQLCEALCFLHDAGKVHRDIKPSNLLVTAAGRLVVLDFGLVTESEPALQSTGGDIVGTPAYMAPEQAAGQRIDAAADCYALGVVLYEALTGRLPFDGTAVDIMMRKQQRLPPDPRTLGSCPGDLADLCMQLLATDPEQRLTAGEALELLAGSRPAVAATSLGAPIFLGRAAELEQLQRVLDRVGAGGGAAVVHVEGQSGVGKSALVGQFCSQLRIERSNLMVLNGRCYEREMTHYRAFDGVIDVLQRALAGVPDAEAAELVPPDLTLLARMFPMLEGLAVLDRSGRGQRRAGDVEARMRAYAAFRELLNRMARRWRLVVVVDDVQWADRDSLRLIAELLRAPGSPPVLWVLAARPVDDTGAWLREALGVPVERIVLAPLDAALAETLAGRLLAAAGVAGAPGDAAAIARETDGHPLHIAELVRHAAEAGGGGGRGLRLDEAIVDRLTRLPPAAQDVAELLALAGAPMRPGTLRRAADVEPADLHRALAVLRIAHLIRRSGAADEERIEP